MQIKNQYTIGRILSIFIPVTLMFIINIYIELSGILPIIILLILWILIRSIIYYTINVMALKKVKKENTYLSEEEALEMLSQKILNNEI